MRPMYNKIRVWYKETRSINLHPKYTKKWNLNTN